MVNYECLFCSFRTSHKGNYIRHIKTPKHRKNEIYYIKNNGNFSNYIKCNQKEQSSNHSDNKQYPCRFCSKIYSYRQNRSRHEKNCKQKNIVKNNEYK